jgi:hypothetical protein
MGAALAKPVLPMLEKRETTMIDASCFSAYRLSLREELLNSAQLGGITNLRMPDVDDWRRASPIASRLPKTTPAEGPCAHLPDSLRRENSGAARLISRQARSWRRPSSFLVDGDCKRLSEVEADCGHRRRKSGAASGAKRPGKFLPTCGLSHVRSRIHFGGKGIEFRSLF